MNTIHDRPLVAVIMAAYNAERTLPEAIKSVLASTLPVGLVIVDDASRMPAEDAIVRTFGDIPPRVTILRCEKNMGPSGARNLGFKHIIETGYRYAAVLDSDDIAHPERFTKQVGYLEGNPAVAAVGTWGHLIDATSLAVISAESYPPVRSADVRRALCFDSCIINTSVMFRVSALQEVGVWDESLYTAEDYDLFCRLARKYELANLPEYLVNYRSSPGGISLSGVTAQRRARLLVQLRHFPFRFHYWQAWVGVAISAVRLMTPTPVVDKVKQLMGRRRVFG
ncbi:MAG: glycosyltransferase [Rhodospirillales bacterium]|nr:glycosyltransferase [Rhodospirillales bacterium]